MERFPERRADRNHDSYITIYNDSDIDIYIIELRIQG